MKVIKMTVTIQSLFDLLLRNDPAEVMQISMSPVEIEMADLFWPQELHLSKAQKVMLFQDRKLSAMKILEEKEK